MAAHVRFESWNISLPSSAKQQPEMTKPYVVWRMCSAMANCSCLLVELKAVNGSVQFRNCHYIFSLSRFLDCDIQR